MFWRRPLFGIEVQLLVPVQVGDGEEAAVGQHLREAVVASAWRRRFGGNQLTRGILSLTLKARRDFFVDR